MSVTDVLPWCLHSTFICPHRVSTLRSRLPSSGRVVPYPLQVQDSQASTRGRKQVTWFGCHGGLARAQVADEADSLQIHRLVADVFESSRG